MIAMSFRFPARTMARGAACAVALFCASAFAASTGSVDLEPRWQQGAQVDYLLTKTGMASVGGVVKVNTTNTTPVHVAVVAVEPNAYVLSWTFGETRFDEAAAAAMNPMMKKMAGVMVGRQMLLRVDRRGHLVEVSNWQAIREAGDALAGEVAATLAQSGVPGSQASAAVAQFKGRFASEQSVRAIATREAQLLLLALGHRYDRARPIEFAAIVPNPIGDGFASVTEHVELKSLDAAATLEWTQVAASVGTGPGRAGSPSVRGRAIIDTATGWPASVSQTTSASADDVERKETTSLARQ